MIPLNRTCKQVAALLIAREDRQLGRADRIALRIHMAICVTCPRFERQLLTMGNAIKQWRHYEAPSPTAQSSNDPVSK
jgi:hypothetical protein